MGTKHTTALQHAPGKQHKYSRISKGKGQTQATFKKEEGDCTTFTKMGVVLLYSNLHM